MLTREQVRRIIDRKSDDIAVFYDYFAEETRNVYGDLRMDTLLQAYPDDFVVATREDALWGTQKKHAGGGVGFHAAEQILPDWGDLDRVLDRIVRDAISQGVTLRKNSAAAVHERADRFVVGHWWSLYFETLNFMRSPEHALYDIMLEQQQVRRLFDALEEYFFHLVDIYHDTYHADAIWFGDDYGMQDRLMISPSLFKSLFAPYLLRFSDYVHTKGMKVMMHTCGDVEDIIGDIIDAGIDVLHPIQPGTMDARRIAQTYGEDITFFLGVDTQHIITSGTPTEIRNHITDLAETFSSHGFLLSCANTIMPETPWENIEALFEVFDTLH